MKQGGIAVSDSLGGGNVHMTMPLEFQGSVP